MEDFKIPTIEKIIEVKENEQTYKEETREVENIECPYKIPPWSTTPPSNRVYKFEVLKSGQIIEEINDLQEKAVWKFGRLPQNDITMAHPTISRFHAVLQYRPTQTANENLAEKSAPEGWYIYDLDSTHGTFLNKQRVPSRVFIRIHVGHMLRLGSSSRNYILQGPTEDEEPESELSVTELRELRLAQELKNADEARKRAELAIENEGVSWGMSEDADEETDLKHNPYASTTNEDLFLDDPKRTLRGYFEREGHELEYRCDEMSAGTFVCRVELPIDDDNGRPIITEVVHKGKKKECVVQCALEACRILDRHGVLRQTHQEPKKKRQKKADSDSDDDFLDRTGDVARRKEHKMYKNSSITLTYEDLCIKKLELKKELEKVKENIINYQNKQEDLKKAAKAQETSEDIDSFMENLTEDVTKLDKTEIRKLRMEQQRLQGELEKNEKLIKLTKPANIPFLQESNLDSLVKEKKAPIKKQLPLIGKRNQFTKFKVIKERANYIVPQVNPSLGPNEEEFEEEDDEENKSEDKLELDIKSKKEEIVKVYSPAINPEKIVDEPQQLDIKVTKVEEDPASNEIDFNENTEVKTTESNNKKRLRNRQRKRQDLDINKLEEDESEEKYVKWLPPQNQTGDGFTELNKRFGY